MVGYLLSPHCWIPPGLTPADTPSGPLGTSRILLSGPTGSHWSPQTIAALQEELNLSKELLAEQQIIVDLKKQLKLSQKFSAGLQLEKQVKKNLKLRREDLMAKVQKMRDALHQEELEKALLTAQPSPNLELSTELELRDREVHRNYKFLKVLEQGGYGTVVKCAKQQTGEIRAIKYAYYDDDLCREAYIMRVLTSHNLDKFNIVKYYGELITCGQMSLVYEMLDINLQNYLLDLQGPMRLQDIRTIIQQLATAFDALKRVGLIHSDVKTDNIMMVDHASQPFRVKLIDFGLAIFRSQAKQGRIQHTPQYRAPEITLGLAFSEASDIWSLGCVMAIMVFGFMLFPARNEYDALQHITDLLGPPPEHLISAGMRSHLFL
ncbi:homeodomain-interacting protein kinase 1-like protein [Lates japonicus]|uniref:Homeodomain-interacting protein kinase 1-like protein n=1 Tax=Lates japonicus TaxID=270547 RepID=A0AAD3NCI1_LATJO|nr:homeodomain-interacting protein kinase 1-like protein [Lates japonicus]